MRVIYAGSFSPPTLGHLDIIRRASALFDEVVVAVLSQSEKQYLFSLEKRREMLARVTDDLANVRVVADTGMLVELARREGADVILRGIRDASDLPLEMQMATANRSIGGWTRCFWPARRCTACSPRPSCAIVRGMARRSGAWSPSRSSTIFTRRASRRRIEKGVCKMERDQERFYEDELEPRVEENAEQESDEVDDLKFFLELLKLIRLAINAGTNVPLTNKKIVDADKCLRIIDDMEKNLPDAVQYGMKMYNERERLMTNAETTAMNRVTSAEMRANAALEKAKEEVSQRLADAENRAHDIIADAQERADHMLDESEIVAAPARKRASSKTTPASRPTNCASRPVRTPTRCFPPWRASFPSPSTPSAAAAPNWARRANKRRIKPRRPGRSSVRGRRAAFWSA